MIATINGFCDERFTPLRDAFIANFDEGLEFGASLGVTHRGKMVVDLWAGDADPEQKLAWEKDTIVPVFSTTKIMTAICAFMVIDRGLLKLDEPVAHYWPEFAQGGKDKVTVRDALTHQSGVPGLAQPGPWAIQRDWEAVTSRLAAEPHWFGGERRVCYHVATFGFVVGELIRRTDGRRPAQFFREEIAEKIGADFQITLASKSERSRLARTVMPAFAGRPPDSIPSRIMASFGPPYPALDSWEFQSTEIPAGTGFGNGRSIARVASMLAARGELDGTRYLSESIIAEAGKEQVYGQCPYFGPLRLGLAFGLDSKEFPAPSPTSMHWGGLGGSLILVDPRAQISVGYAPNKFDGNRVSDARPMRLSDALRSLLPIL